MNDTFQQYDLVVIFDSLERTTDHMFTHGNFAACETSLMLEALCEIAEDVAFHDVGITDFKLGEDTELGYVHLVAEFQVYAAFFINHSDPSSVLMRSDAITGTHEIWSVKPC